MLKGMMEVKIISTIDDKLKLSIAENDYYLSRKKNNASSKAIMLI